MREIKFRAWEYDLKEIIEVDDIQFHRSDTEYYDGIEFKPRPRGEQPTLINTRSAWRIVDGKDVTLMQYTGLKDKNGKEIYEGDVLAIPDAYHDYQDGIAINELMENRFEQVNCHQGTFWAGDEWLYEECQHSEIIGNIYENPELLESK